MSAVSGGVWPCPAVHGHSRPIRAPAPGHVWEVCDACRGLTDLNVGSRAAPCCRFDVVRPRLASGEHPSFPTTGRAGQACGRPRGCPDHLGGHPVANFRSPGRPTFSAQLSVSAAARCDDGTPIVVRRSSGSPVDAGGAAACGTRNTSMRSTD